jgi:hypothetical protein
MKFLSRIFKRKKHIEDQLDNALKQGLITNEEILRLRLDRADQEYKNFIKEKKK